VFNAFEVRSFAPTDSVVTENIGMRDMNVYKRTSQRLGQHASCQKIEQSNHLLISNEPGS
jgi:hypothetical protein